MYEIVWRCRAVVYVVMGDVVVVASGRSPLAYIRGLIRRTDRGDSNIFAKLPFSRVASHYIIHETYSDERGLNVSLYRNIPSKPSHFMGIHKKGI